MSLTTPDSIRTLQRKLYIKAKQEPAYRFYARYDKLYRADILSHAWRLVKANGGSPGIDGLSFEAIEREIGVERYLKEIGQSLQAHTYRADPVRRVMIPKADGSERPLGIPTIRDRVVQMAWKLVVEPIFEADFCEHSYGFRPQKSAHDAIDTIAHAMHQGYQQVIDADLSKYFDSIPHAKLLAVIAERIVDGALLALVAQWLKAPIIGKTPDGRDRHEGGGKANRRGTPQGGVASPLLSNCYLHLLDRIWERHQLGIKLQAKLVRYADDFVVLCRKDVEQPLAVIRQILDKLELTLNESKTRVVDANVEHFRFLGFELRMTTSARSGKRYPHVEPSGKAVQKIKDRLTELTGRNRTGLPMGDVVRQVNQTLRGWTGYFHYRNCTAVLAQVRHHAEERLRTHLRKRHKVRNRRSGVVLYPRTALYNDYRLYRVPSSAGWTSAHASV